MPDLPTTLYGQLPFVTSITDSMASAFAWINASHTWVFIDEEDRTDSTGTTNGRSVNFVSEAGAMEFFMYMSSAKTRHIEASAPWTDALDLAAGPFRRSTQRGVGPPRQCDLLSFDALL